VLVHFAVSAPPVLTDDTRELASDVGQDILQTTEARAREGTSIFLARLSPRTTAREGEPIELVVNVNRLHFFDQESGLGIYGS
jgi:multiple sugar transport system ATP-binding protein